MQRGLGARSLPQHRVWMGLQRCCCSSADRRQTRRSGECSKCGSQELGEGLLQSGRGCVAGGGVYGRRTAAQGHLGPRPYGNRHEVRAHMKRWTHRPNRRTHRPGHTKDAQTQAQTQPGLRHTEDTGSDRDLGTGLRETHSGRRGPPTHAVTAVDSLAQTSLGWPPRPELHPQPGSTTGRASWGGQAAVSGPDRAQSSEPWVNKQEDVEPAPSTRTTPTVCCLCLLYTMSEQTSSSPAHTLLPCTPLQQTRA